MDTFCRSALFVHVSILNTVSEHRFLYIYTLEKTNRQFIRSHPLKCSTQFEGFIGEDPAVMSCRGMLTDNAISRTHCQAKFYHFTHASTLPTQNDIEPQNISWQTPKNFARSIFQRKIRNHLPAACIDLAKYETGK